jgi:hypothetical protein
MDSLPSAALSVHHFVSSVGADAGFAALIAVAILVLLYFAQARETATLRTRAEEADFRAQALEVRVADLTDQLAALPAEISVRAANPRVATAYRGGQGQLAGVPAGVAAAGDTLPPAAPAGVAAPALAAATRLIPDPVRVEPEYAPASAAARSSNGSSGPAVAASAATIDRPVQAARPGAPRPVAAPVRAGGGSGRPPSAPSGGRPPGAGQPRPGGAQARPGSPARPGAPMRPPARRSRGRLVLGALVAGVAVAAVVAGVIILTGGGSKQSTSSSSKASASTGVTSRAVSAPTVVVPSTVTVSVLNGTDMQGLASQVSQKLSSHGYRKGAVTNASDQTRTTTVIQYAPHDKRDALAVAATLKLPQSDVQPLDSATQKIACSASALGCSSPVYVTVGHNLATQP